jgi:DtxR family Mn-dependent transcriptional regulator
VRTNVKERRISATQEDYLRAIYLLQKHAGTVSVTSVAEKLQLSKSTVSERLQGMVEAGLVRHQRYGSVTLTTKGAIVGRKMTHKHRVIEVFLHDTLGMSNDEVHDEADRLEHALSDSVIRRLGDFLGHPTEDPHGSVIPKLD